MSTAKRRELISVDDYLAGELESPTRHEYVGEYIYARAGARNAHNLIASNTLGATHARLRGKPCRPYNSDTKIRIRLPTHWLFYYPDTSIICRPNPQSDSFQDEPAVIFEVLSESTRRIDEGEKKSAYLTIPSLAAYVLIEQDAAAATVFRRTPTGVVREVYEGHDAILPLPEIDIELPLAEIYEEVAFEPEAKDRAE